MLMPLDSDVGKDIGYLWELVFGVCKLLALSLLLATMANAVSCPQSASGHYGQCCVLPSVCKWPLWPMLCPASICCWPLWPMLCPTLSLQVATMANAMSCLNLLLATMANAVPCLQSAVGHYGQCCALPSICKWPLWPMLCPALSLLLATMANAVSYPQSSRLQDFIFVLRDKGNLLAIMRMTNTKIHIGPDTDATHLIPPPPPTHKHTHTHTRARARASMYRARVPLRRHKHTLS